MLPLRNRSLLLSNQFVVPNLSWYHCLIFIGEHGLNLRLFTLRCAGSNWNILATLALFNPGFICLVSRLRWNLANVAASFCADIAFANFIQTCFFHWLISGYLVKIFFGLFVGGCQCWRPTHFFLCDVIEGHNIFKLNPTTFLALDLTIKHQEDFAFPEPFAQGLVYLNLGRPDIGWFGTFAPYNFTKRKLTLFHIEECSHMWELNDKLFL